MLQTLLPELVARSPVQVRGPILKEYVKQVLNRLWLRSAGLQSSSWLAHLVKLLGWASHNYTCIVLFLAFVRYQQNRHQVCSSGTWRLFRGAWHS